MHGKNERLALKQAPAGATSFTSSANLSVFPGVWALGAVGLSSSSMSLALWLEELELRPLGPTFLSRQWPPGQGNQETEIPSVRKRIADLCFGSLIAAREAFRP